MERPVIVISTLVIAQDYVSENKESRRTKYCEEALYNNCFICNLRSYLAFVFRIVSIRSRIKLALCLNWPNIIPNGSRRGRKQNRDYQSQNLVNEVAVESHLPIFVIDSVKRRHPSLQSICYWSPGDRRPNKRSPGFGRTYRKIPKISLSMYRPLQI